jgi:hypothetical protein
MYPTQRADSQLAELLEQCVHCKASAPPPPPAHTLFADILRAGAANSALMLLQACAGSTLCGDWVAAHAALLLGKHARFAEELAVLPSETGVRYVRQPLCQRKAPEPHELVWCGCRVVTGLKTQTVTPADPSSRTETDCTLILSLRRCIGCLPMHLPAYISLRPSISHTPRIFAVLCAVWRLLDRVLSAEALCCPSGHRFRPLATVPGSPLCMLYQRPRRSGDSTLATACGIYRWPTRRAGGGAGGRAGGPAAGGHLCHRVRTLSANHSCAAPG